MPAITMVRTARSTGLLYLALAITGAFGFLLLRPLLVTDVPAETVARFAHGEAMARLLVALELGIVLAQAFAAIWFFRLFRSVDAVAAGALAAFGLANAIVVLGSAATLGAAIELAREPIDERAASVHVLVRLGEHLWAVGKLFFGAWLIPMGRLALLAGLPRLLGWLLVAGGAGYIASTFLGYLLPAVAPGAQPVADLLVLPATAGEFWMIAYLLHGGAFRARPAAAAGRAVAPR